MDWLLLVLVVALVLLNVPIAWALGLTTIVFLLAKGAAPLTLVPLTLFSGASSFPLLAIPLFILAGGLMETGGISLRLVNLAHSVVGFVRGGLAMATVVATMIQSEISDSSVADAAAILIPPSIPMIIYAWMAEVSVGKMFFAGFVPGFFACAAMLAL